MIEIIYFQWYWKSKRKIFLNSNHNYVKLDSNEGHLDSNEYFGWLGSVGNQNHVNYNVLFETYSHLYHMYQFCQRRRWTYLVFFNCEDIQKKFNWIKSMGVNLKNFDGLANSKEGTYTAVNIVVKSIIFLNKKCFKYRKNDSKIRIGTRDIKEVYLLLKL